MSQDFTDLIPTIKAKLDSVTELSYVADFYDGKMQGFPAATFEPSGNTSDFITNVDNFRGYTFDIYIHQEMKKIGRRDAIRILAKATDAVITAFDEDFNLGGVVDFCAAVPSDWGEYTGDNGPTKYALVTLVCKKEIQVFFPT